jgi:ferredoxin
MAPLGLLATMSGFKLEIVRSECIGCELCTQTCPELFQMAADGLSSLPKGKRENGNDEMDLDDEGCSRQAADECPVTCIHIYENGQKVI